MSTRDGESESMRVPQRTEARCRAWSDRRFALQRIEQAQAGIWSKPRIDRAPSWATRRSRAFFVAPAPIVVFHALGSRPCLPSEPWIECMESRRSQSPCSPSSACCHRDPTPSGSNQPGPMNQGQGQGQGQPPGGRRHASISGVLSAGFLLLLSLPAGWPGGRATEYGMRSRACRS